MTIALLATGDEIVHGDTLNTNSHYIAQTLSSEGLSLGIHMSCSDKIKDILSCITYLSHHHDIIIIIGGLGPTTDDLTRFAVAEFTNTPLIENKDAKQHIAKRIHRLESELSLGNLQQCLIPAQALLLPNHFGTALGYKFIAKNITFILLPGPPKECLPMFQQFALPILQKTFHSSKRILKWRIFGLAESEIAQKLEDALQSIDCQTGYRWESPYIEFKVRCTPDKIATISTIIDPLLKPHIICPIDKKASQVLIDHLKRLNQPIFIKDSATAGLLQSTLTTPQLKNLLYFDETSHQNVQFIISGLKEFWDQAPALGLIELKITCNYHEKEIQETHLVPFRSMSVLVYAVELLSFRIFHLINQIH